MQTSKIITFRFKQPNQGRLLDNNQYFPSMFEIKELLHQDRLIISTTIVLCEKSREVCLHILF